MLLKLFLLFMIFCFMFQKPRHLYLEIMLAKHILERNLNRFKEYIRQILKKKR